MTLDINITLRADNGLLDLLRSAVSSLLVQTQAAPAAPQTPAPAGNPTFPGPATAAPATPTPQANIAAAPMTGQTAPLSNPAAGNTPRVVPTPPQTPAAPVTASSAPAASAVPTTPAPGYTLEQISRAGAALIAADPGKRERLITLLQQFGVQTIDRLPQEQYGAFATALRGLGASI